MDKQLTINLDEKVYDALYQIVDRDSVSKFIEDLLRPYVIKQDLELAYKEMAEDEQREEEALEWSEAFIGDIADDMN
jgi:predicted CopG family antitoxin